MNGSLYSWDNWFFRIRRGIVLLLIIFPFGCNRSPSPGNPIATELPNIIVILVDDLGWRDVGFNGSVYHETPNLDRLAGQGMVFKNAYASSAVCSPSRAAIQTGVSPAKLKITNWIHAGFQLDEFGETVPRDSIFRPELQFKDEFKVGYANNPFWMNLEEETLAELLKKRGFHSGHIGKWHLGLTKTWFPEAQGYDVNIGGTDFGQPPSYFDPYFSERFGAGDISNLPPRDNGEYLTDREGDEAINFISKNKDRPFFLHLAHYAVHTPIQAKEDIIGKYASKDTVDQQTNATYAAMVESVDQSVGRIMEALDSLGLARNTLLIFTSDNGGEPTVTSNAPLRSGKGRPYEGGIRVPQIIRWPAKIAPGSVSLTPVIGHDIFPTLAEITGTEIEHPDRIEGSSLLPLMEGKSSELETRPLYWHYPHYVGHIITPFSVVQTGGWKLIKWYEGPVYELFDLKNDPFEERNVISMHPEKSDEMRQLLENWLVKTEATVPKPNPAYREAE